MKWRIFDNFTGTDIEHGTAYLSPQGDTKVRKDVCNLVTLVVGCFVFNGPLRQYFSLYRAVSQREGDRGEKG